MNPYANCRHRNVHEFGGLSGGESPVDRSGVFVVDEAGGRDDASAPLTSEASGLKYVLALEQLGSARVVDGRQAATAHPLSERGLPDAEELFDFSGGQNRRRPQVSLVLFMFPLGPLGLAFLVDDGPNLAHPGGISRTPARSYGFSVTDRQSRGAGEAMHARDASEDLQRTPELVCQLIEPHCDSVTACVTREPATIRQND